MQPHYVVLLQSDPRVADSLTSALSTSFASVERAGSLLELRGFIAKHRASIAILDIEATPLSEVGRLSKEFPQTGIVCTHRLADEDMWSAALEAGAIDICPSSDIRGIVRSVVGKAAGAQGAAA